MTSSSQQDHSLNNPAVNAPCSRQLEALVSEIGRDLAPGENYECSLEEIARIVCSAFKLKPPILEAKIITFLETAGIYQKNAPAAKATTFVYNRVMSRWEIHTRPCAPHDWSREVWHEVWEILFWRCYYRIPWWREWAAGKKYDKPHDSADRFAYLLLLSSQSVPAQARKHCYDVYEVAKFYGVPTSLAFNALSSCRRFSHPLLMALIRLDAAAPVEVQITLERGLFVPDSRLADPVHAHVYQKTYKPASGIKAPGSYMSVQQQKEERAMKWAFEALSKHFHKNSVLEVLGDDPMYYNSRQIEARVQTVRHLFGLDLETEVSVITRQSPRDCNEIFLQVMPPEEAAGFMPCVSGPEDATIRVMLQDWKRAARGGKKRPLVTGGLGMTAQGGEEDPFEFLEAA